MSPMNSNSQTGSRGRRLLALALTIVGLLPLAGCVQSVYPFYEDSDVVFDGSLAGTWVGEGALKPCLLNITADPDRQGSHYDLEFSKVPGGCPDLDSGRAKLSGRGQVLQVGQQRFFDVWDGDYYLHNILKIKNDSQTLSLVPIDPDLLGDLIERKAVKLEGRIEGHSTWPDGVLLTSPSKDLRSFLSDRADDKELFSEKDALRFHRQ